jgi:hypothetical protein
MSQGNTIGSPAGSLPGARLAPWQRAFARRSFVVAVLVMATVGLGMQFMTSFMKVYFKKEPVALRGDLLSVPDQMGSWVKMWDEPLTKEVEDALATKEYVFRDYVDARVIGQDKVNELMKLAPNERKHELDEIQWHNPRAVIHFAVTYYTGLVDTVAHIPDRCYIADGYEPTEYNVENWKLGDGSNIEVRNIHFEDQNGFASKQPKNVAYFFQVNGVMESDPLGVRRRLQNLFNRQGYYAKIEIMTVSSDHEESAGTMRDFLTVAMPEVHKKLPPLLDEAAGTPQTQPSPSGPQTRPAAGGTGEVAIGSEAR